MARSHKVAGRIAAGLGVLAVVSALLAQGMSLAIAQPATAPAKPCIDIGDNARNTVALPNTARALRTRKQIKVLAVGAAPLSLRGREPDTYALVESYLEKGYKGLDVEIIDRGISGELARDTLKRIREEVALTSPDVVFWQVGLAEGMARTPPDEFKATLNKGINWLKAHNVDVVLIGMRYVRSLAKDSHYRAIRQVIRDTQKEQDILRVGHYEAMEALDLIRAKSSAAPNELDLTVAGSECMADFLSRAIAAKLFAKPDSRGKSGSAPGAPAPGGSPAAPKK